ncbi:MAG: hypothetical protein ACYS7Y_26610, partial [Planctomycetota bacterium]
MRNLPHHFIGKLTIPLRVLPAIFLFDIGCFVREGAIMSKKLIYLIFFVSMLGLAEGQAQDGYRLQAISGADGVFQTVIIDGVTVYRSLRKRDTYDPYMYFRCSEEIRPRTVYLEVTYKDIGYGIFGVEYNSMTT